MSIQLLMEGGKRLGKSSSEVVGKEKTELSDFKIRCKHIPIIFYIQLIYSNHHSNSEQRSNDAPALWTLLEPGRRRSPTGRSARARVAAGPSNRGEGI